LRAIQLRAMLLLLKLTGVARLGVTAKCKSTTITKGDWLPASAPINIRVKSGDLRWNVSPAAPAICV